MKQIVDPKNPEITRLQTDEERNETELDQYRADFCAKLFIVLGLPDEIYQLVDQQYTAHDLWQALVSLHHEEEL